MQLSKRLRGSFPNMTRSSTRSSSRMSASPTSLSLGPRTQPLQRLRTNIIQQQEAGVSRPWTSDSLTCTTSTSRSGLRTTSSTPRRKKPPRSQSSNRSKNSRGTIRRLTPGPKARNLQNSPQGERARTQRLSRQIGMLNLAESSIMKASS